MAETGRHQEQLPVIGAYVRRLKQHRDNRGFFEEIYNKNEENNVSKGPARWEQVSVSTSGPDVLRGIHISAYGKLVT
eukprot:7827214-Pyramimonas_sp.AAC.1